MYPNTPNFATTRDGDGWVTRTFRRADGSVSHDEICQMSGALFLVWVRSKVRWDMVVARGSNPYVIGNTRYSSIEQIDQDFRFGSAWTPQILEGYNEYLNRKNRPSVSNPLVRSTTRQFFDTRAVTSDLLKKLISGGIGNAVAWNGNLGSGDGITIAEGAILPSVGQNLGVLPSNPQLRCIHRENVDASYREPEAETASGDGSGLFFAGLALGLIALYALGKSD